MMNIRFGLLGEVTLTGSTSIVMGVNIEINWTIGSEQEVMHCTIVPIGCKSDYTVHDMTLTWYPPKVNFNISGRNYHRRNERGEGFLEHVRYFAIVAFLFCNCVA